LGTNRSTFDFGAVCFKAGGTAVAGSSSQASNVLISANAEYGFSIIQFTTSNSTASPPPMNYIAHGLNSTPKMVIYFRLNSTQARTVFVDGLSTNGALYLNLNNAENGPFTYDFFDNDSTNIGVRSNYALSRGQQYMAYVFADVDGVQKIGTYTGQSGNVTPSSTNAIGFRPRLLLLKGTNWAGSWYLFDSERGFGKYQVLDTEAVEGSTSQITVSDTGFSISGSLATHNEKSMFLAIA
jgi:hypothetical protein